MYYPDEIIEEVRNANDIVEVISSYIPLTRKGSRWFGLCPFHNEKTGSFSVSGQMQMYYCFGCGAGGNVFTFVMQYENFTFDETMHLLAERAGIKLPELKESDEDRKNRNVRDNLLQIHRIAAGYYYHNLIHGRDTSGLDYLKKRQLTDDTIRHFGLGFAPKASDALYRVLKEKGYDDALIKLSGLAFVEERGARDKFFNRVMFPIMDINNKVIGFGGRVMGEGEPKYLNSPETQLFDKSRNLYGIGYARKTRKDFLLLCEGYMDVIALHQAGFTNAVASLGTAFTKGHAALIKRYVTKVVITYDSDAAGIKAAQRALPILKEAGISARILSMAPYKDPDEFIKALGAQAFEERIMKADNAFLWQMGVTASQYDMSDPEQKTAFELRLAGNLALFSETMERDNYVRAAADRFMIRYESLREAVNAAGNNGYIQVTEEPEKPYHGRDRKDDNGLLKTQGYVLSCALVDPALCAKLRKYLVPDDFDDDIYREIAGEILAGEDCSTDAGRIISSYLDDPVKQARAAGILSIREEMYAGDPESRRSALSSSVKRIKAAALKRRSDAAVDMAELSEILKEQAKLDNTGFEL